MIVIKVQIITIFGAVQFYVSIGSAITKEIKYFTGKFILKLYHMKGTHSIITVYTDFTFLF